MTQYLDDLLNGAAAAPADRSLEGLEPLVWRRVEILRSERLVSQLRLGAVAMALATDPKLLLLDEPMAGMGPEESAAMVDLLRNLKGGVTMLLVEHDMDAVFALADRITVLVYGRAIATGTPEAIRENPEVRVAYLGEDSATA